MPAFLLAAISDRAQGHVAHHHFELVPFGSAPPTGNALVLAYWRSLEPTGRQIVPV